MSSSPNCAASTRKERLWSCSAPSASSTTSTASTTLSGWSRQNQAKAVARHETQTPLSRFRLLSLRLRRNHRRFHAAALHRLEDGLCGVELALSRRSILLVGWQARSEEHTS